MNGKKPIFNRSEYDELLSDVLNHADGESENIEDAIVFEEEEDSSPMPLDVQAVSMNIWAKSLVILCVMSLGWYGFSGGAENNSLSEDQAAEQLQQVYGPEYNTVRQLNTFISDKEGDFDANLQALNQSFSDEDSGRPEFLKEYFYLFGDTLVYTEPRSTPEDLELGNESR